MELRISLEGVVQRVDGSVERLVLTAQPPAPGESPSKLVTATAPPLGGTHRNVTTWSTDAQACHALAAQG
jgi:hypothetical protein